VKENQFTATGLLVWGTCALLYLYGFFIRTVIGTYQTSIMNDLHLSMLQFSLLSSAVFLSIYGLMQIPAGIMANMYGLKNVSFLGVLMCTVAVLGFAFTHNYSLALLFRMCMGFGTSFGFICLLLAIYEWIPHSHSALFIGLSQFIGVFGPMFATGPLYTLSKSIGAHWRFVFICLSILGAALLALTLSFVRNNKKKAGEYIVLSRPEKLSVSIKKLFSRSQPLYIAIVCACLNFTLEYFSANEGRSFLFLKGVPLTSASYMLSVAWIGFAIGSPLLGFLSDFFNRRKNILVLCSLIGLISTLTILYNANKSILYCAFFLLGVSASAQGIGFALIADQFKKKFVALGFGLNNAIIMLIPAVMAPFLGFLLDCKKAGSCLILNEYLWVFNILILIYLIALALSCFLIKETYGKSLVDFTYLKPKKNI